MLPSMTANRNANVMADLVSSAPDSVTHWSERKLRARNESQSIEKQQQQQHGKHKMVEVTKRAASKIVQLTIQQQ